MKRNKFYPIVKKIFPLLSKESRFCGRFFVREQGYEILDYTEINRHLFYSYCCNECAKDEDEVKEKVNFSKCKIPSKLKEKMEGLVHDTNRTYYKHNKIL